MAEDDNFKHRTYLGDGVYAKWDGYHIWLHTQQGMYIALEPAVMSGLKRYEQHIMEMEYKGIVKDPSPSVSDSIDAAVSEAVDIALGGDTDV